MSAGTKERRKCQRLIKSLPARISMSIGLHKDGLLSRGYEIMIHNLSEGGIWAELNIPEKDFINNLLPKAYKVDLDLRLVEKDEILNFMAEPVWIKSFNDPIENRLCCGFKFIEATESQKKRIASYIDEFTLRQPLSNLENFTLLIDGEKIDTCNYEYFPYAEKTILEFKSTYKIIHQLKKGLQPRSYKDYIFARYCIGEDDSNQKAIKAAYKASKIYKSFSLEKRRKIMGDIHDLLVAHRDKLIELFVIEGHSKKLAKWEFSGMEKCLNRETLNFYTSEMEKEIKNGDETIYIVRKPDGVICLSPPKNAACSNSLLASLIFLSGNTIIVKPPLKMPISTIYLWEKVINKALKKNGAPDGCVNIILGNSKIIMDEWLESPFVNDIICFGDSEMGLDIGKRAYLNNKKAILELSGNDMLFVWKDADIEKAISSLLDAFLGSTQICMVPKNAIIHQDIYDEFVEKFIKEVASLKVGLPSSDETYLTPVMKSKDFFNFLNNAVERGAELVQGGRKINHDGQAAEDGTYLEPTILSIRDEETAKTMKVVQDENFFPLLPLVRVAGSNDDEIFRKMKELSDMNQYGLRISVWVKSQEYQNKFIRDIQNAGILKINSRHVAFSMYTSTHGGTGKTGGPYGEMNYVWHKTSHLQGIVVREE